MIKDRFKNLHTLEIILFILLMAVSLAGCGTPSAEPVSGDPSAGSPPTETESPAPLPTSTVTPEPEQGDPVTLRVVPAAALPELDGTISPGEWEGASVFEYEDGSELILMHAGGVLYLAVRASAPEMIMANVFVQRGDQISILHSSAALGTATYARSDGVWTLLQNFDWRCRDTGFSESAQAERDAFWQQEGWVAANAWMGTPNELEYQISLAEEITSMAVIFVQELVPIPFPVGLDDACVRTYPDGLPEELGFSVEEWVGLELVGD